MQSFEDNVVCDKNSYFSHSVLQDLVESRFPEHPFSNLRETKEQLKGLLSEYLAMSMAFPYIQAGACGPFVLDSIKSNRPIRKEYELTSVVGSFLVWDELGGWFNTVQRGARGLSKILDTRAFHANVLGNDLKNIFGEEIKPNFGPQTQKYLISLQEHLSSSDDIQRCAAMVSFELHAERMITELWESVQKICEVEKNKLRYFAAHVGGDDPAEAYHVKMTESLIEMLTLGKSDHFEKTFLDIYQLHINWCQSLVKRFI